MEGERILEVEDGEDEADELAKGDDQGHHKRGAFGGQDEHARNANVSADQWI